MPRAALLCVVILSVSAGRAAAQIKPPVALDERLTVELIAAEPDIRTPVGAAVDGAGRIWTIENNTHFRPKDYKGHPSDRILIFEDFAPDGKARKVTQFADGFKDAMGLALGPGGRVYLATRADIRILRDTRNTGKADESKVIVRLETAGNYPHNGLCGFAFDPLGNVYFGFGENLGAPYKLVGSDKSTLSGGGEGGNVYVMRPDGSRIAQVATGFWNPFHMCVDAFGRLFVVDNDPDDRPPCRLLHVIPGGDFGFKFKNGRKGLHPFTAWNGELAGTLPMVAGTAEAPSGVTAYESDNLPEDYRGELLATSWGDHVLQRFRLEPRGASVSAVPRAFVRGDQNFRPVGIATAPDGSLVITDWVDKSYPLHGKGRIWRVRGKSASDDGARPEKIGAKQPAAELRRLLGHAKAEVRSAAGDALAAKGKEGYDALLEALKSDPDVRTRMQALWSAVKPVSASGVPAIRAGLIDKAPEIRAEAVRLCTSVLGAKAAEPEIARGLRDPSEWVRLAAIGQARGRDLLEGIAPYLGDSDPFLLSAAIETAARNGGAVWLLGKAARGDARIQIGVLAALRRTGDKNAPAALQQFLFDPDPAVRQAAVRWIGEEKLTDLARTMDESIRITGITRGIFESYLAAREALAGVKPGKEIRGEDYVAGLLWDARTPSAVRAIALRTLRPDHPTVTAPRLAGLFATSDRGLVAEVVRTLAMRSDEASQDILRTISADERADLPTRLDAILGLGRAAAESDKTRAALTALLKDPLPPIRADAVRSLRSTAALPAVRAALMDAATFLLSAKPRPEPELAEQLWLALRAAKGDDIAGTVARLAEIVGPRPKSEAEWLKVALEPGGDVEAGRRALLHTAGARCFACHRVNGRGGVGGPDLSNIGRTATAEKIHESILNPSREIAPQYVQWAFALSDGRAVNGVIVSEDGLGGATIVDNRGEVIVLKADDVVERKAQKTSLMPDNLVDLMTRREFRDLAAFLREAK